MSYKIISILILISNFLSGQTVITKSNFPVPGSEVKNFIGTATGKINIEGGENQVWDFSGVNTEYINDLNYVNSIETKMFSDFKKSTVAFEAKGTGDFTYLNITEDKYEYLGFEASNNGSIVYGKYDNSWTVFSLPLHFNDKFNDTFSSSSEIIDNGDTVHNYFKGHYSYIVDGYGILITPFRTYKNTLRITAITIGRDSSVRNGINDTTIVNDYTTRQISWLSSDESHEFAQVSTFDFKDFFFQDGNNSSTDLKKLIAEIKEINLFPNPTSDFITLEAPLDEDNIVIYVYNSFGNNIKVIHLNNYPDKKIRIAVDDLAPAMYYIKVTGRNSNFYSRFIKN